jgi:hypothetical protein
MAARIRRRFYAGRSGKLRAATMFELPGWRDMFVWRDEEAHDVEFVDYH